MHKPKLVVLSGAGISAESGVATFRDAGGLWEGHNVMDVASPEGWKRDPQLVLDFYNLRRRQLQTVKPNLAHIILKELEQEYQVTIITQNVDDLHERAGSTSVLHLHGELLKVRSIENDNEIYNWTTDLSVGDIGHNGSQLRPHIVWFGEHVALLDTAIELCANADICVVIGTSMQVYPAAGLVEFVAQTTPIYYIDPNPAAISLPNNIVTVIREKATVGMKRLKTILSR